MEKFNELKKIIQELELDMEKCFVKSNKSAGVRVRAEMQKIKQLAQDIRNESKIKKND